MLRIPLPIFCHLFKMLLLVFFPSQKNFLIRIYIRFMSLGADINCSVGQTDFGHGDFGMRNIEKCPKWPERIMCFCFLYSHHQRLIPSTAHSALSHELTGWLESRGERCLVFMLFFFMLHFGFVVLLLPKIQIRGLNFYF